MAGPQDFDISFILVVNVEGGYTDDPDDAGNWTGGKVGVGELKGTKYGISAASYPNLDIANLSMDEAKAIYRKDYWTRAGCPRMPPRLAHTVFDAAVNNGVSRAVSWVQTAVMAKPDGIWGPATSKALGVAVMHDPSDMKLAQEVHAQRIHFMADLSTWETYGLGWSRRLALVPLEAALYWPPPPEPPPVDIEAMVV